MGRWSRTRDVLSGDFHRYRRIRVLGRLPKEIQRTFFLRHLHCVGSYHPTSRTRVNGSTRPLLVSPGVFSLRRLKRSPTVFISDLPTLGRSISRFFAHRTSSTFSVPLSHRGPSRPSLVGVVVGLELGNSGKRLKTGGPRIPLFRHDKPL